MNESYASFGDFFSEDYSIPQQAHREKIIELAGAYKGSAIINTIDETHYGSIGALSMAIELLEEGCDSDVLLEVILQGWTRVEEH